MPDIDPDLPLRLAKTIADIYGDAATQLLQAVARRLARGIDEPGWAESKMAELVGLRDEARAVVDRLTVLGSDAVREALTAATDKGATAAATELAATLKPVTSTPAVDALAEQTISQLDRTHMQILRSTEDVYRRVIAEVSAPGVVTGSLTQRQAAARALDRFAQKGVTGFVDRAGRRWELESYVEMATRTASGRAMIDGRLQVYEAEDRDIVIVSDAPEECSVCRPFEGRLLSISGRSTGHTVDGKRVIDSVKGAQAKGLHHPNCFPGDVLVAGPSANAADTRWYEGDLVVIHTASGHELPVTPNHPVLTAEGWVAAGALHVGDQLVRHVGHQQPVVAGVALSGAGPHDQQVPTRISEVADALRKTGPVLTMRVPAAAEQFHGDGLGGDVDVVLADRFLQDGVADATVVHPCGHASLVVGGVGLGAFLAERTSPQVVVATGHPSDGVVSGGDLGRTLLGSHGGPLAGLGFATADAGALALEEVRDGCLGDAEVSSDRCLGLSGLVPVDGFDGLLWGDPEGAEIDTGFKKSLADDLVTDLERGRDLANRLASVVLLDEVVDVELQAWSGHVYNLQTVDGWYTANGIVVHNCRHDLRPYIPGLTKPVSGTADPEGDRLRQEQRRLERRIREAKRRVAAAEPFGDPELGRAKARLQQRQADMRKFVADHDRKRFPEREKLRSAKSGSGVTPARAGSGPDVGSPSSGGSRHGPKVTGSELRSAPGTSRSARRPPGDLPKPASKAVKTFEDDHAKRVGTTALDAISKVHRIPPNLPKFTAVAEQLPRGDRAAFDPLRMTLALDPVDGDAFSFVHEFGHWLDWTALKAREWSSVKDARLGEFRDAVHASRRYQELATEMDRLDGRIRRRVASADDIADFKHIAYLLEPQELWSRAYSQWVTTESGAPALLAGLKAMQPGSGSRVPDQWADGDFGPIAVVIRKLFESRGLLP